MISKEVLQPMNEYLKSVKADGRCIFSEDTIAYLTAPECDCQAFEFVQEDESDEEFLVSFAEWMHEMPVISGHVEYYLLLGLRPNQPLSQEAYEFLERNVCDCFEFSHGWCCELTHRFRFRLRIKLIMSCNSRFTRMAKKAVILPLRRPLK